MISILIFIFVFLTVDIQLNFHLITGDTSRRSTSSISGFPKLLLIDLNSKLYRINFDVNLFYGRFMYVCMFHINVPIYVKQLR